MILAPAEEHPALPFPFQSHSPLSLFLVYFPLCYFPSSSVLSLSLLFCSLSIALLCYLLNCFLFNRFAISSPLSLLVVHFWRGGGSYFNDGRMVMTVTEKSVVGLAVACSRCCAEKVARWRCNLLLFTASAGWVACCLLDGVGLLLELEEVHLVGCWCMLMVHGGGWVATNLDDIGFVQCKSFHAPCIRSKLVLFQTKIMVPLNSANLRSKEDHRPI